MVASEGELDRVGGGGGWIESECDRVCFRLGRPRKEPLARERLWVVEEEGGARVAEADEVRDGEVADGGTRPAEGGDCGLTAGGLAKPDGLDAYQ